MKRHLALLLVATASLSASALSLQFNPFQYSSAYVDPESSLQYLNARYYQPATGHFISHDSFDLVNRYGYADDNPVMNEDPSGHSAVPALSAIGVFSTVVFGAAALYDLFHQNSTALFFNVAGILGSSAFYLANPEENFANRMANLGEQQAAPYNIVEAEPPVDQQMVSHENIEEQPRVAPPVISEASSISPASRVINLTYDISPAEEHLGNHQVWLRRRINRFEGEPELIPRSNYNNLLTSIETSTFSYSGHINEARVVNLHLLMAPGVNFPIPENMPDNVVGDFIVTTRMKKSYYFPAGATQGQQIIENN